MTFACWMPQKCSHMGWNRPLIVDGWTNGCIAESYSSFSLRSVNDFSTCQSHWFWHFVQRLPILCIVPAYVLRCCNIQMKFKEGSPPIGGVTTHIWTTVVTDRWVLAITSNSAKTVKLIKHRRDCSISCRQEVACSVVTWWTDGKFWSGKLQQFPR